MASKILPKTEKEYAEKLIDSYLHGFGSAMEMLNTGFMAMDRDQMVEAFEKKWERENSNIVLTDKNGKPKPKQS